jgi:hypothetical protein
LADLISFREDFALACLERMALMKIANGYQTDIKTIAEWRFVPLTANELPALILRDLDSKHETLNKSTRMQTNHIKMQIEGVVIPGPNAVRDARRLIADITQLIAVDREWGGKAIDTTLERTAIAVSQEEGRIGGALVEFTIHFGSIVFNSYE